MRQQARKSLKGKYASAFPRALLTIHTEKGSATGKYARLRPEVREIRKSLELKGNANPLRFGDG
jgi:hypothetical protein